MTDKLKIQPVEPCGAIGKCMASPSSYASQLGSYASNNPKAVAAHALRALETARAQDVATHEKNLPAIEINKQIAAQVEGLMETIGMPRSWSERDLKSRSRYPKSITHQAGWIDDVRRHCRTDDGFAHATSTYERMLKEYQSYAERAEQEAAQAAAKAQREKDAELAKRRADMELAAMLLRYQLPIESTWGDVLDHLVEKNQRLRLAVAMQQTRMDWNEGAWRVHGALGAFQIETTEDKDIANDIASCLADFEDGRVFRDTEWNYDRLFASVAEEHEVLTADCRRALEMSSNS